MNEIENEILNLASSPLYAERIATNMLPVVGEGSLDAKIMFVGEAPGKNEALTGKPFCGASGKVLDELLSTIGLDRKLVYVTSIVKDRPPRNRDPLPAEIAAYAPFLMRQIDIIRPRAIATLGRFSMAYLFNEFGMEEQLVAISAMHGRVFVAQAPYGKVSILPLYHPAVALYKRSSLEILKQDFKQLKKFM